MATPSPSSWTADEIALYANRYGLTLSSDMLARLRMLADRVSATGAAIPRQPLKACEPALSYTVHLE